MATLTRFEDIEVWKLARNFAKDIYSVTNTELFRTNPRFREQIRASSGSIMDNIAEGFEREGVKEFIQFLYYAKGSCGEARSQLHRALDVQFINNQDFERLLKDSEFISKSLSTAPSENPPLKLYLSFSSILPKEDKSQHQGKTLLISPLKSLPNSLFVICASIAWSLLKQRNNKK